MPETEKGLRVRYQALTRPVKVAGWAALSLCLYALVGFLLLPLVAQKVLEKKLPPLLHRPVSIGKISLNPFTLELTVADFHVAQKEGAGDLLAFDRLFVNLEGVSLVKRALIVKALRLDGPRLEFSHLEAQSYSFSDLLTETPEKKAPPQDSRPFQFAIQNIEIQAGRILFHDLPKRTEHTVTALNLGIPSLSNLPYQVETYVKPAFAATINGTPFALGGQSKPFAKSLETALELKATGINLPEYLAYIPNPTGLVLQSALLDIDARLHLLARPDNSFRLALIGRLAVRELALADQAGKSYLRIPELALTLADSDLLAKEAHLTELHFQAPLVNLERLADGRLQPLALLRPEPLAAGEPPPGDAGHAAPTSGQALKIDIDKVALSDGRVTFVDAAAGAQVATRLDIDTSLHLLAGAAEADRLNLLGRVSLRELTITDSAGKTYLSLPELALTLAEANLLAKEVHCREITLQAPTLTLERRADGQLLPVALLVPAEPPPAKVSGKTSPPAAAGEPFRFTVDRLALGDGRVDFHDAAVGNNSEKAAPAHLRLGNLAIQLEGLSNSPDSLGQLSLTGDLNQAGKIKAAGQLGLAPFQTRLNLQLSNLALKPFQPYISEQARLVIAGGQLTLTGALALSPKKAGGLRSDFQGEAALANLATVDAGGGEDLLKWRQLEVSKIHYASDPGQLSVAAINLVEPYVNVLLGRDGVMNLATIRPEQAAAAPPTPATPPPTGAEPSPPFTTRIGRISVSGGRLDFQDRQVEPAYGTSLGEISGSVSDLSSLAESSADVAFAAKLDQQAPMRITGRINPLRQDLFVDLKVDFSDINLSPISPYSGKYIGYKIDKGKLNLDLKYDIANRQLNSQNKAFLDQLTLGESVDSPEAANLPVRLALALLRDRKGGINLDLPVEGSLDDPNFRIGRVVIQILINLISKAATSPIALLGALIPEGQDIQFIAFAPGESELIPESAAKLVTVEKVLYERPELRLELLGGVEPVSDRAALARRHLNDSVKLQKLLAGGGKEGEAHGVQLSEAEYPAFLALAYQAALKSDPTRKPLAGKASLAEMEAFLLAGIRVDEAELRLLALNRASRFLNSLVAGGRIEAGRLFVVEPRLATAGEVAAAQVQLLIK